MYSIAIFILFLILISVIEFRIKNTLIRIASILVCVFVLACSVASFSIKIGGDLVRNDLRLGFVSVISELIEKENFTKQDLIVMRKIISQSKRDVDFNMISESFSK